LIDAFDIWNVDTSALMMGKTTWVPIFGYEKCVITTIQQFLALIYRPLTMRVENSSFNGDYERTVDGKTRLTGEGGVGGGKVVRQGDRRGEVVVKAAEN
jgi:hypothetical protein